MRRFGFLLAVLVLVIFLSALFSKPSVVNRGTAQRMEHYPTVGIGDIFRGALARPRATDSLKACHAVAATRSTAIVCASVVYGSAGAKAGLASYVLVGEGFLSAMARVVRSRRETPYATRNANGMENSAGWV